MVIFLLCGNHPKLLRQGKHRQFLSCSLICSFMQSTILIVQSPFWMLQQWRNKNPCKLMSKQEKVASQGVFCHVLHHRMSFRGNAKTSVWTPGAYFFNNATRLRCRATFIVLVQFITKQQYVAALQPGEAGGLRPPECLLWWLIMITMHGNKALFLP